MVWDSFKTVVINGQPSKELQTKEEGIVCQLADIWTSTNIK